MIETANHFRCIDLIIDNARNALTAQDKYKAYLDYFRIAY